MKKIISEISPASDLTIVIISLMMRMSLMYSEILLHRTPACSRL